jgi:glucosyl-3-phosphoglycerate phosphatase
VSVVWLVRHAAVDAPPGVAIGTTDPPLSASGVQQAREVAARLATRPLARVVSSDKRRAVATAELIAAPHGLAVERAAALREIDFGRWEGRSLAALWEERPDEAAAWEQDLRRTPSGFGESFAALEGRVLAFWDGLRSSIGPGEVALVGHRGSLVVLLRAMTGMSLEGAWREPLEVAAALSVEVEPC